MVQVRTLKLCKRGGGKLGTRNEVIDLQDPGKGPVPLKPRTLRPEIGTDGESEIFSRNYPGTDTVHFSRYPSGALNRVPGEDHFRLAVERGIIGRAGEPARDYPVIAAERVVVSPL
jgi:hypothetical protein